MADLMTLDQYTARLGRTLTGVKAAQAQAFLEDASAEVRRLAGGAFDDADHETVPAELRLVLFSMVTRARTNPRGLDSERIGDWQGGGMGSVYATDEEKQIIRDCAGISAVREIQLTGDMPQRLLDEAEAFTPYTHLGDM